MKLQIAFDIIDLNKALELGEEVQEYADIFEVGSLLIYKHGIEAITVFKERFPEKIIFADAKIVDRGKEAMQLFTSVGSDWISVMAGTSRNVIYGATQAAHEAGKKVMLDLLDASSLGQSALESKSLGVDALLFHYQQTKNESQSTFLESWDMVKGNTQLPVYITVPITQELMAEVAAVNPAGIVISANQAQADAIREASAYIHSLSFEE